MDTRGSDVAKSHDPRPVSPVVFAFQHLDAQDSLEHKSAWYRCVQTNIRNVIDGWERPERRAFGAGEGRAQRAISVRDHNRGSR